MKKIFTRLLIFVLCFSILSVEAKRKKKPRFKPYYAAQNQLTDYKQTVEKIRTQISASPFKLVGEYSPYPNATIFAITNDNLLQTASKSEFGGYGSVIRVSVTQTDKSVQVAYVNPTYMSYLYQMKDLPNIAQQLTELFGESQPFGSKRGLTKRSLNGYQYMMMMPEFEDHDKLGKFNSYEEAVATVNKNLASGKYKLSKVFEVKIPGKDETLIGVGIQDGDGADSLIMKTIDTGKIRHTAHLPYAVLISGKTVYSQAGKFRIASSFPDLGMGQFMDISDAPEGIENSLKQLTTH